MTDLIPTTTTRRAVLAAAALPAAALPAIGVPAMATDASASPLLAAFEEWKRIRAWADEDIDMDEDERARRVDVLNEAENEIFAVPAQDATDLAIKILVMARFEFGCDDAQMALVNDSARFLGEAGSQHA